MRKFFFLLIFYLILLSMFLFPQATFLGAKEGLILWFYTVLPTLFPFVVISNLLMHTNAFSQICELVSPILTRLFKVSPHGTFAIITGFLCGYPMGAKVIADLMLAGKITQKEGQYLLSFCNNASPMFIISYVVLQHLGDRQLVIPTLLIVLGAPLLSTILFRCYHKPEPAKETRLHDGLTFSFSMLDKSVMNGFYTITCVGGYIMMFSVVTKILLTIFPENALFAFLEITNGIPMLTRCFPTYLEAYVSVLILTTLGGMCSIIQTKAMIQKTNLKLMPYVIEKLITALIAAVLGILLIL